MTSIGAQSGYSTCTQESLSVTVDPTTNRINSTGFSYDSSGNMTGDGINTYAWNAESELKSAAGVNYTYDGDGNRVQKSNGKIYWYGAGSEILDESDASGNITDEYVSMSIQAVRPLQAKIGYSHRHRRKVYFYNGSGVIGKPMKLKDFLRQ